MSTNTTIAPVLTLLRGGRVEGELPLVTKGPIDHLAEEDLKTIHEAEFLHEIGREDEAKAMIAALETKLGITSADKAAAFGPQEPWEGDLLTALGLAPVEDPVPVLSHDPGRLTGDEIRDAGAAIDKLGRAKTAGNRKLAGDELERVLRKPRQRVDGAWRRESRKETVDLATARGEDIDDRPAIGGLAITSRDGLRHLRQLGHLTDAQYAIGLTYRAGYEARSADLQASTIGEGGSGHDNDKFVAARLKRARALDFVARVDRAVAIGAPIPALQMLRWVAGDAGALRAWGGGRAFERNRTALKVALDIAISIARVSGKAEKTSQ